MPVDYGPGEEDGEGGHGRDGRATGGINRHPPRAANHSAIPFLLSHLLFHYIILLFFEVCYGYTASPYKMI